MYWEPGDRIMIRQEGVVYPATVRGGYRTELRDERGAPYGWTETYIVTIDDDGATAQMRSIDGATILGAAPD